jgi:hypothetical protein
MASDRNAVRLFFVTHAAVAENASLPVKLGDDELTGRDASPHDDDDGGDIFFNRSKRDLGQLQHLFPPQSQPSLLRVALKCVKVGLTKSSVRPTCTSHDEENMTHPTGNIFG